MGSSFTRIISLALLLLIGLVACNQGNEDDSNMLQANAYLDVAKIYRNQGQFRAGIIEAQNALQTFPEHKEAQRFVSQLYMELGDHQTALEMLERLIAESPADAELGLL